MKNLAKQKTLEKVVMSSLLFHFITQFTIERTLTT